ncbi:MAG: AI-2E family transporter [Aureispira sp.]|nr:AI-2E family transporter [Aureispira sp.]
MQSSTKKYLRYAGVFLSVILSGMLIYHFSDIVGWVVMAWVISMLGSPLMGLLAKLKIGRFKLGASIRALIVLMVFYVVFGLLFYMFVPVIVQQARNLAGVDFASIMVSLEEPIANVNNYLVDLGVLDEEMILESIDSTEILAPNIDSVETLPDSNKLSLNINLGDSSLLATEEIYSTTTVHIDSIILANGDTVTKTNIDLNLTVNLENPEISEREILDPTTILHPSDTPIEQLLKKLFQYISPAQLVTQTVLYIINLFGNFLVLLTSVTFIAFFFLKDEELFGRGLKMSIPNKYLAQVDTALGQIRQLLTRYFGGVLLQISLISLYVAVLLGFLGVPNAILIAFFAALINVIPYIGPIIGMMFALLVTISSNLDVDFYAITLPMLLKVIFVFLTMQTLDAFVLQPIIFSSSVLAHPLEIFIVVILGAKLGGIIGMVVAIPLYTILRVMASVFLNEFKLVQSLTDHLDGVIEEPPEDDPDPPQV